MRTINLRDWTMTPGPRKRAQGDFSAEAFLKDVLFPALGAHGTTPPGPQPVLLDLDGVAGVPHSWLDEVLSQVWLRYGEWDAHVCLSLKLGDDPDDTLVRAWEIMQVSWDVARLQ